MAADLASGFNQSWSLQLFVFIETIFLLQQSLEVYDKTFRGSILYELLGECHAYL